MKRTALRSEGAISLDILSAYVPFELLTPASLFCKNAVVLKATVPQVAVG